MPVQPVRFIHISDTHIGTTKDFLLHGSNPYKAAETLIQHIKQLPFKPDFIMNTGDVAAMHGEDAAYDLAESLFKKLDMPCYYVTGNHDISERMQRRLTYGEKTILSEDLSANAYKFEKNGIDFLILNGRGPDSLDPHGLMSDYQMELLKHEIKKCNKPLAIFVHFPATSLDSVWLDRDMLLLNGDEFHKAICAKKEFIRGVFCGHVHRGMTTYQDGILYSSVGSSFLQFYAWPEEEKPEFQNDNIGFYNVVTLTPESTIVKQQYYIVPSST